MREIKFRAWDKGQEPFEESWDKPRMIYSVENLYDGSIPGLGQLGSFGSLLNNDQFIVMQYTGLKDKNGKEIYEGDVIHVRDRWSPPIVDRITNEVFFQEGCFWIKDHRLEDIYAYCEVIGNIHENKELLNASHQSPA